MVDDSVNISARLAELFTHERKAEFAAYARQVLYCDKPEEEARRWLESVMEKHDKKAVVEIAYRDPNPENRRAAGMVIVRNALNMPDERVRREHLEALIRNGRLHPDARDEAARLLRVERRKQCQGDDRKTTLDGMPPVTVSSLRGMRLPECAPRAPVKATLRGKP